MTQDAITYKVEYLLLLEGSGITCGTVESLFHLFQSDSNIVISTDLKKATYKSGKTFEVDIVMGSATQANEQGSIYFDMSFSCDSEASLETFGNFLRSIRVVIAPLIQKNRAAMQILRDDLSLFYRVKAYPSISNIENSMRRLITKFMQVNVGMGWTSERMPDEISNSKSKNDDDTFLHNVDFIKLIEILLSQNYSKDQEALIKNLKSSSQETFTKAEIEALMPTSNWDKYFSVKLKADAEELERDWNQLYVLRCKVAHNRTFTRQDLEDTLALTMKVGALLEAAQKELDTIRVDEREAQGIAESAAITTAPAKEPLQMFMTQWRGIERHIIKLVASIGENAQQYLTLMDCVRALQGRKVISSELADRIGDYSRVRNVLVHFSDKMAQDVVINYTEELRKISAELFGIRAGRKTARSQKQEVTK